MNITTLPSPNMDVRRLPVSMLVLHYTGMESGEAALERLCDPKAKVSAHYVVGEKGEVWQLINEQDRAWHAGISFWRGITDINSASIGIEIVNGGHDYGLPEFQSAQIKAVITLCKDILSRHDIPAGNIVGHSDIAPDRKMDPGELFPWASLSIAGVGRFPLDYETCNISEDQRVLFEPQSRDRGISIVQSGLAHIGYDVKVTGVLDMITQFAIAAVQRRYRPDCIDGQIDVQTLEIIRWLSEQKDTDLA